MNTMNMLADISGVEMKTRDIVEEAVNKAVLQASSYKNDVSKIKNDTEIGYPTIQDSVSVVDKNIFERDAVEISHDEIEFSKNVEKQCEELAVENDIDAFNYD